MKAKRPNRAEKRSTETEAFGEIKTKEDLKSFLTTVRERLSEDVAAPVYAATAMNYVMNLPEIYQLLESENKEIARDIWLRIKQSGMQLRNPVLLFGDDGGATAP